MTEIQHGKFRFDHKDQMLICYAFTFKKAVDIGMEKVQPEDTDVVTMLSAYERAMMFVMREIHNRFDYVDELAIIRDKSEQMFREYTLDFFPTDSNPFKYTNMSRRLWNELGQIMEKYYDVEDEHDLFDLYALYQMMGYAINYVEFTLSI